MKKILSLVVVLVIVTSGCTGVLHYKNRKGFDAKAEGADILIKGNKIDEAKAKLAFGSTFNLCIQWPWRTKGNSCSNGYENSSPIQLMVNAVEPTEIAQ